MFWREPSQVLNLFGRKRVSAGACLAVWPQDFIGIYDESASGYTGEN